jgi:amidase
MRTTTMWAAAAMAALGLAACSNSAPPSDKALDTDAIADQCLDVIDGVNLQTADVLEMQSALDGKLSSEALVERYLERIATFDRAGPKLNSVRVLAPDALEQARAADKARKHTPPGKLKGLAVLIKDNIGTTDMTTTAGSIALELNIPKSEATLTRKLRAAGAIVLGKANLSEFANWVSLTMPNGYSSLGGQVIAPYDFTADPSGSSTGPGVAGTMAFSSVAIGTETSGSIISPSTAHALVGVKPTVGLVSRAGIIPLSPSFDTAGPMTRNVIDAAAVLGVIAGADPADPATDKFAQSELKGVVPDYVAGLDAHALKGARLGVRTGDEGSTPLFDDALKVLQDQGAILVEIPDPVSYPIVGSSDLSLVELGAIFNEFKTSLNDYLATQAGPATPVHSLTDIILFNNDHPDQVKYGQDLLIASDAQSGVEQDPLMIAARIAAIAYAQNWIDTVMDANQLDAIIGADFTNISVTAAAGYPDVTVPMGFIQQEPHGLEFAGHAFSEQKLLSLAYAYEQATHLRKPATVINPNLRMTCPQ